MEKGAQKNRNVNNHERQPDVTLGRRRRRVAERGGNKSTEVFVSNVTTLAGNIIYYSASLRRGNCIMDGNCLDDEAVEGHHGTDCRTVVMKLEHIGITNDARYPNICIKGGGQSQFSETG